MGIPSEVTGSNSTQGTIMKQQIITGPDSRLTERASLYKRPLSLTSALCCALAVVWSGCTTQQQQQQNRGTDWSADSAEAQSGEVRSARMSGSQQQQQQRQRPTPTPAAKPTPAPAPAAKASCSDPTWGLISVTKTMPRQAILGGDFAADLTITARACAGNVVVRDTVPENANYVRSEPAAAVEGDQLTWKIGDMEAGQTINAKVWLKATKEGMVVNCTTVSADPRVCAATRIVSPAIQLTKTGPKDVLVCDPIPMVLVVRNTGSSQLTGVKVSDTLPTGLSSDGKNSLLFDAGTLAPGESKEFKFNATASAVGNYVNSASVTSDQGVGAKASATTAVHRPVLALSCKAREQQYMGRPFDVCFTVSNNGDVPAADAQVAVPVPAGLTLKSATAGGRMVGNNLVWDIASLAVKAPQELCATFTGATGGTFNFNATAKGVCATQVSTSCATKVIGISALLLEKADNPDPIEVGETTTYTVKVTNQGSADDTNVKISVEFPEEVSPVSASNGGVVSGRTVTFPAFPRLAPKQAFEYSIVARGVKVGDARVTFIRTSDGIPAPTTAEESTRVY